MAYAQGGLIQATDYNSLINGTNQLNTVWGTGFGNVGYGQSNVAPVSASSIVTATQWASLINTLNNIRTHQTGSGSGISAVTAGQQIDYLSTLQANVASSYADALLSNTNGSTTVGTVTTLGISADATSAYIGHQDVNVRWATAEQARFFFNAGGKLNFICSAVDNIGNPRSISARDIINNIGGVTGFGAESNGGRSGSGGTISVEDTDFGYYDLVLNTPTLIIDVDDAAPYATHNANVKVSTDESTTTNGANGTTAIFRITVFVPADDVNGGSLNVTLSTSVDVVFPESTYLSTASWGAIPTITFDTV